MSPISSEADLQKYIQYNGLTILNRTYTEILKLFPVYAETQGVSGIVDFVAVKDETFYVIETKFAMGVHSDIGQLMAYINDFQCYRDKVVIGILIAKTFHKSAFYAMFSMRNRILLAEWQQQGNDVFFFDATQQGKIYFMAMENAELSLRNDLRR